MQVPQHCSGAPRFDGRLTPCKGNTLRLDKRLVSFHKPRNRPVAHADNVDVPEVQGKPSPRPISRRTSKRVRNHTSNGQKRPPLRLVGARTEDRHACLRENAPTCLRARCGWAGRGTEATKSGPPLRREDVASQWIAQHYCCSRTRSASRNFATPSAPSRGPFPLRDESAHKRAQL